MSVYGVNGYQRVLVGVDGSPTAARAAERAINVACAHGGELHIVDVVPLPAVGVALGPAGAAALSDQVARNDRTATEALEQIQRLAAAAGLTANVHLAHGEPAAAILATAAAIGADVIVVGNRGVDGAGRYVLSSVPELVLHGAPCDVLIAHTV